MKDPALLEFDWPLPRGVGAAFTTRCGGASAAPWDTFNIGAHVGDAPSAVAANRARLRTLLALPSEPHWLSQVHGDVVLDLGARATSRAVPVADGAVTRAPGAVCVIMVADCLPVLFASRDGTRIGAAHAGWRGLAAGVLENTVAALDVPAGALTAWLGPAISQPHFEVGDEVRAAFVDRDAGAAAHFTGNARGRWQADLIGLARRRLEALGLIDIHGGRWCTVAGRERFFSHRRDGQISGNTGRMAALIWRAASQSPPRSC
jgi:YfiH family protein